VFQVEPVRDEVVGQRGEQFGMRRRVADAQVVLGLDQPATEEVFPVAIDESLGEERIFLRRHPLSQP